MLKKLTKRLHAKAIDPDNPEWTRERLEAAKPAAEVLTELLGETTAREMLRPRGRPLSDHPKQRITIRLSQEVVEAFRRTGDGWQTRIDAALKQYLSEHPL